MAGFLFSLFFFFNYNSQIWLADSIFCDIIHFSMQQQQFVLSYSGGLIVHTSTGKGWARGGRAPKPATVQNSVVSIVCLTYMNKPALTLLNNNNVNKTDLDLRWFVSQKAFLICLFWCYLEGWLPEAI